MPGNIGPLEIAIVLIIALLVFGPKRLPELGKSVGKGIREFKASIAGDDDEDDQKPDEKAQIAAADPTPPPPSPQAEEKREAEVVRDKS